MPPCYKTAQMLKNTKRPRLFTRSTASPSHQHNASDVLRGLLGLRRARSCRSADPSRYRIAQELEGRVIVSKELIPSELDSCSRRNCSWWSLWW